MYPFRSRGLPSTIFQETEEKQEDQVIALIIGYIREFEVIKAHVPTVIKNLIIKFCPYDYKIYGIGKNVFGEFGLGHKQKLPKYFCLSAFSELCFHPSDIYGVQGKYLIRTKGNSIYGTSPQTNVFSKMNELNQKYYITPKGRWLPQNNKFLSLFAGSDQWFRIFHGCGKTIVQIECGNEHTLLLSNRNRVYAWGSNTFGQCGCENNRRFIRKPSLIPMLHNVIEIHAGHSHNLCLTKTKQLWVWGHNQNGELGIEHNSELPLLRSQGRSALLSTTNNSSTERKTVTHNAQRKTNHRKTSNLLNNHNNKHGHGHKHNNSRKKNNNNNNNNHGRHQSNKKNTRHNNKNTGNKQKNHKNRNNNNNKRNSNKNGGKNHGNNHNKHKENHGHNGNNNNVTEMEAENDSKSKRGQRLPFHNNQCIYVPSLHPFFDEQKIKLSKICCGTQHTAVITDNGKCYFFGRNREGQIGNGNRNMKLVFTPHLFQSFLQFQDLCVNDVSCGFMHTLVLCTDKYAQLMSFNNYDNNSNTNNNNFFNMNMNGNLNNNNNLSNIRNGNGIGASPSAMNIYAFGKNKYNECSLANKADVIYFPHKLTENELMIGKGYVVKRVIAGLGTTLIITAKTNLVRS